MKPPIFGYDDRYFLECENSREQLFELQNQILSIVSKGSSDIAQDLKTAIDHKEIDLCLRACFSKKLVYRERISVENQVPVYRYYTN